MGLKLSLYKIWLYVENGFLEMEKQNPMEENNCHAVWKIIAVVMGKVSANPWVPKLLHFKHRSV